VKSTRGTHSIVHSMLNWLNVFEEGIEYEIEEIPLSRFPEYPIFLLNDFLTLFEINTYQKKSFLPDYFDDETVHLIKYKCPVIKVTSDTTFKIISSPIYSRFNDIHKALCYLDLRGAYAWRGSEGVELPVRFLTEEFNKELGHFFRKNEDGLYLITPEGLDEKNRINEMLVELMFKRRNIDDVFNEYYNAVYLPPVGSRPPATVIAPIKHSKSNSESDIKLDEPSEIKDDEFNRALQIIINEIKKTFPKGEKLRYADISDYIMDNGLDDDIYLQINKWCLKNIDNIYKK